MLHCDNDDDDDDDHNNNNNNNNNNSWVLCRQSSNWRGGGSTEMAAERKAEKRSTTICRQTIFFMPLFSAGSSLTHHLTYDLARFMLNVTSQPFFLAYFLLWCSSRLCTWPSTLHHVHYPSQYSDVFPFPGPQPFTQMTPSSSRSTHSTLIQTFRTFKTLLNRSLLEWQLIFLLLTPLRLNSCSSDSKTYLPKYTTLHLTPLTLPEILASSLMNILFSNNISLSEACYYSITFVNFAVFGLISINKLPLPLLPLLFTPSLITVILCTINSLSLNYVVSSRSKTLLIVLSLQLLSPVI